MACAVETLARSAVPKDMAMPRIDLNIIFIIPLPLGDWRAIR